jgi:rhamnogalacturonan endolyase
VGGGCGRGAASKTVDDASAKDVSAMDVALDEVGDAGSSVDDGASDSAGHGEVFAEDGGPGVDSDGGRVSLDAGIDGVDAGACPAEGGQAGTLGSPQTPVPSASFGLADSGGAFVVNAGAGLVFKVEKASGDITSLNYRGVEYQDSTRHSQVNSGLATSNVSATSYGADYVKITVVDTSGTLTHYYLARNGLNQIYMATYFTQEPTLGLVRFIVRIPHVLLPQGPPPSDSSGNLGPIEAQDIFGMADGTTRSKHYSNHRLMDWASTGATGNKVGVFMIRSNHEGDSGGPFYRCLINQAGDDQEIYEIVNYGEAQTESFRMGVLNGPYVLTFTDGAAPNPNIDSSWLDKMGLLGWVPDADRGRVSGMVGGMPQSFQAVVGFSNDKAQYWTTASCPDGKYTSPLMIPGTYTAKLYKGELEVAHQTVTVAAQKTQLLDLNSTEPANTAVFRIGDWDGAPAGLMNADKMTWMHPSDVRMTPWKAVTFRVGTDPVADFPSAQWKDENDPATVVFNMTSDQTKSSHVLRIGITTAFSGGRPTVAVNAWTSAGQPASTQPSTRTLTIGSYRGNNVEYDFAVPASAFVEGQNTLVIKVLSGSGGSGFLSPAFGYDAVEMD